LQIVANFQGVDHVVYGLAMGAAAVNATNAAASPNYSRCGVKEVVSVD
jgi:hypothetical protein